MKIDIKPISINKCFQGKRYKTPEYKKYENDILFLLPKLNIPKGIKLKLSLTVGYSSKGSDLDNVCKPFQDILSKKYGFNDNQIYELHMFKNIVDKGNEYIAFEFAEI